MDHRAKRKERETRDKYLEGLVKGLETWKYEDELGTSQTTALIRIAKILRRVLKTCGDLLSL